MAKTEEVEAVLREALDTVIQHGVVLVHGEYGVVWNELQDAWTWDREMFVQVPHCCCIGAYMVTRQPHAKTPHGGDIYDAAVEALRVDPVWLRDLMNGFDNCEYQGGGYPDAHTAGVRLRREYQPLCFEYLALTGNGTQTSAAYKNYLRDYCLPAAHGLMTSILLDGPRPTVGERPSGTYPIVDADEAEPVAAAVG